MTEVEQMITWLVYCDEDQDGDTDTIWYHMFWYRR